VHVGDAAVGDPRLDPVQHPLAGRRVIDRPGPDRPDVAARIGLGGAERAQLHLSRTAEHLRAPLPDLLGRPVGHDGDRGQRTARQRQPDPGIAPEQFLERDRDAKPGFLQVLSGVEVQRVQPDLGGLLQHRPRGLLALVPLRGGRADHRRRELVQPVPHLHQVIPEFKGESRAPARLAHAASVLSGLAALVTRE
jgi:hypothetical protein